MPKLANSRMSSAKLFFLGHDLTTKKVGLYVIPLKTKEPLELPKDNFIPAVTSDQFIKGADGTIIGMTTGESQEPSSEMTLTLKEDFSGYQTATALGNAKNLIEAVVKGHFITDNGNTVEIVGTNGTMLRSGAKASACEILQDFGLLFELENRYVNDGQALDLDTKRPKQKINTVRDKYNLEVKSFGIENYLLLGSGEEKVEAIYYLYNKKFTNPENESANQQVMTIGVMGDCKIAGKSLLNSAQESPAMADEAKIQLEVDYIVKASAVPSDFKNGAKIALVNPTTGAVTLHVGTASAWTASAVGSFVQYAKIMANNYTETTISSATKVRSFVVLKTVNATNGGVGASFSLDSTGTVKEFVCKTRIFDENINGFKDLSQSATGC